MIGSVVGGRSKLLDALERTTLEGGKDIIKRALNAYVKKHKGDPNLADALDSIREEFVSLAYQGKVPE